MSDIWYFLSCYWVFACVPTSYHYWVCVSELVSSEGCRYLTSSVCVVHCSCDHQTPGDIQHNIMISKPLGTYKTTLWYQNALDLTRQHYDIKTPRVIQDNIMISKQNSLNLQDSIRISKLLGSYKTTLWYQNSSSHTRQHYDIKTKLLESYKTTLYQNFLGHTRQYYDIKTHWIIQDKMIRWSERCITQHHDNQLMLNTAQNIM